MLVHSIFESISGEAGFFLQGTWCTFIRLQGCNLRCKWCDTLQAQEKQSSIAKEMTNHQIANQCKMKHVLITGGEPLYRDQLELFDLISILVQSNHLVQIETNGSLELPVKYCPPKDKVFWVMDRKCPSSGMHNKMILARNFKEQYNSNTIILKYVISDLTDLKWAHEDMLNFKHDRFLISPANADGEKITWIRNNLPIDILDKIVFSLQIHKIVNLA